MLPEKVTDDSDTTPAAGEGRGPRDTAAAAPAASVRSLSKSFKGVRVLEDVSFDVAEGEALVLLGASGSGKTTILRVIAGLERRLGQRPPPRPRRDGAAGARARRRRHLPVLRALPAHDRRAERRLRPAHPRTQAPREEGEGREPSGTRPPLRPAQEAPLAARRRAAA